LVNSIKKQFFQASFYASLFCFTLLSCSPGEKVVASVDDVELTESDAHTLMEYLGYSYEDKTEYRAFLEQWCENETFKAELKDTDPITYQLIRLRGQSFEREISKYYLEEKMLKNELDTLVNDSEIVTYYEEHKDEFILHDYIVKALYLKIPKKVDFKADNIHNAFLLKNDKDLSEINSYAKLYAENYYFNDSTWVFFNELSKDIPLGNYNTDNIVLNRSKTYFSDEKHTYFLNIIDFNVKDEAPPVEFLRGRIREIIVLDRLQVLKEKNESSLIQTIKEKHEINVHI
jgi:hypothetical protein